MKNADTMVEELHQQLKQQQNLLFLIKIKERKAYKQNKIRLRLDSNT